MDTGERGGKRLAVIQTQSCVEAYLALGCSGARWALARGIDDGIAWISRQS